MKETSEESEGQSLLTPRQLNVLKLRQAGLSQQEVAKILGTSRSNVSILEKRALQNVERARATLKQWRMIKAPISIKVPKGTDVFEVPGLIFKEADRQGVKLDSSSVDVIVRLRAEAPQALDKRIISKDLEVYVSEEGEVLVQETAPESGVHSA